MPLTSPQTSYGEEPRLPYAAATMGKPGGYSKLRCYSGRTTAISVAAWQHCNRATAGCAVWPYWLPPGSGSRVRNWKQRAK